MFDFTPSTSAQLNGPTWLIERRRGAAERLEASRFPTPEEELWRYSPIRDLRLDDLRPVLAPPSAPDGAERVLDDAVGFVATIDGFVVAVELDDALAAKGVRLGPAGEDGVGAPGRVLTEAHDAYGELHDAFLAEAVALVVPDGVVVDGPLVVAHLTSTDDAVTCPHLTVDAGSSSAVRIVEMYSGDRPGLVIPVTEIAVGSSARVGYTAVQDLGPSTWQLATLEVQVEAQGSVTAGAAAFGGAYARLRTDCHLTGRGSTGDLLALYFGNDDQTLDFRTFQEHVAPDTTSNLLFKGALDDRARSIYSGLIRVHPDARGTNAFQTNRNIKLSEQAWAESVPNLEIENNDVRCSHASTVGPIDEEQLFYLETRGVPEAEAERLIVAGFFDEVIGALATPGVAPRLRQKVADKLAVHAEHHG